MYIKRHLEEVIKECLEQFPIVLVTGPRQVGKTTLLQCLCDDYKYVILEDVFVFKKLSTTLVHWRSPICA